MANEYVNIQYLFILGNYYPQAQLDPKTILLHSRISNIAKSPDEDKKILPNTTYWYRLALGSDKGTKYYTKEIKTDSSAVGEVEFTIEEVGLANLEYFCIQSAVYKNANPGNTSSVPNESILIAGRGNVNDISSRALYFSSEDSYIELFKDSKCSTSVSCMENGSVVEIVPLVNEIPQGVVCKLPLFTNPYMQQYTINVQSRYSSEPDLKEYQTVTTYTIHASMLLNHSSLSRGNTILPLRLNEKITNLKYNYADSTIATLGNPYPFIRRNGAQKYRTFNIEAIIAFEADEANDFMIFPEFSKTLDEYDKIRIKQKMYRDKVLAFLHDGQTKLFRSFQEGNMLVRLSNISLTPNAQLDRNIWTFSAQVTEVATPTIENYAKYALTIVGVPEVVS